MPVARRWVGDGEAGVNFRCPGCETMREGGGDFWHGVRTEGPSVWGWNGDLDRPTFTPSVLVRGVVPLTEAEVESVMGGATHRSVPFVCHSFVTDGRIQFLGDCTHGLAGQTVDLPKLEERS